jgi:hypothetical protein
VSGTLQDDIRAAIPGYPDPSKQYKVGPPHKARLWLQEDPTWFVEHTFEDDEGLVVLSRTIKPTTPTTPTPTPKRPIARRIKEAIRGSRKS